jgi:pyrimidine operon attenuation protein/uracil phosphoribosyltransferase
VRPVKRCYNEDSWNNELVVRPSSVGKNVSTEAEDIVKIRQKAKAGEDTKD